MPDLSQVTPVAFNCEGGLVLNRSTFLMQPGEALELENFEPDIEGGYRRINGFSKYVSAIVPQTSSASEKVLMVATFANKVVAARGTNIFTADPAGSSWTTVDSNRTSAGKYNFERYNFDGNDKLIVVDGNNAPTIFNTSFTATDVAPTSTGTGQSTTLLVAISSSDTLTGSSSHTITVADTSQFNDPDSGTASLIIGDEQFTYENISGNTFTHVTRAQNSSVAADHAVGTFVSDLFPPAVAGAKFVVAFKEHMFYAGMSANKQELVFSAPFIENSFSVAIGAGSIKVDDEITGLKVFREDLFIFCQSRIFKLSGSSQATFSVTAVTRDIGCINGDTIQEFAGDLIFLGPDGLRTIAGTARIGDVELGTISSNVQSLFDDNLDSASEFESVVIPDKTQYRIFFTKAGTADNATQGVVCVLKGQRFEFSKLRGIKPASTDTFVSAGDVITLHGAYSGGYIYRQESGNDFDGTAILGKYRGPDMTFGDAGIRKHMQRVIVNFKPESTIDADLFLRYDYESKDSARPAAYELDSADVAAIYGTATYGASSTNTGTYGGASQPLVRQAVEGSGFAVALRVNDGGSTAPYSLKGFQLEYQTGARR